MSNEPLATPKAKTSAEILAAIGALWTEILAVNAVSPSDDFFALGGDSVAVSILNFRIEEEFGVPLDPGVIFDAPTLEQLSAVVSGLCQDS